MDSQLLSISWDFSAAQSFTIKFYHASDAQDQHLINTRCHAATIYHAHDISSHDSPAPQRTEAHFQHTPATYARGIGPSVYALHATTYTTCARDRSCVRAVSRPPSHMTHPHPQTGLQCIDVTAKKDIKVAQSQGHSHVRHVLIYVHWGRVLKCSSALCPEAGGGECVCV